MGSFQKHIQQWKHNRSFVATIEPAYPDWIVTVSFYVALHAVDSLLAADNVTGVCSHETRKAALLRTNRYQKIAQHFLPLYDLSRTVRYLAEPAKWVQVSQVETNVFNRYLYPIEKSVQNLIQQNFDLKKIELRKA